MYKSIDFCVEDELKPNQIKLPMHLCNNPRKIVSSLMVIICYTLGYTHLPSVQRYSRKGESGHVQGAILHEATDMTHALSEYPGADDKTNLGTWTVYKNT